MTSQTLPNYPDLFTLESHIVQIIENECRIAKHLNPSDSLLNIIKRNLAILAKYNLDKNDICNNHRNMYLKFNKTDEFDAYSEENGADEHARELINNCPPRNEWSCHGKMTNEITLNGQHLRITCIIWGGAEECPIETYFNSEYHGYSRGDRDWFVTNLTKNKKLWIPDLLPAQIAMFGFNQSSDLPYHLDLEKYIDIMGITGPGPILILPTIIENYWFANGTQTRDLSHIDESYLKLREETNDNYHAIESIHKNQSQQIDTSIEENKKRLLLHFTILFLKFTNVDWLTSIHDTNLIIFDRKLQLYDFHKNIDKYYDFSTGTNIILAENDQSNEIRKKMKGCIIL